MKGEYTTLTTTLTTYQPGDSPIGCSEDNVACIAHTDNLVEYVGGISDIDECRQLCNDQKECQYLTYYDITSFPYSEACYLLKNCDERVSVISDLSMLSTSISIYIHFNVLLNLPFLANFYKITGMSGTYYYYYYHF